MIYHLLEDAIICELESDENAPIPKLMVLDKDVFEKLRSELVVENTDTKLAPTVTSFTLKLVGNSIEIRSEDWADATVH